MHEAQIVEDFPLERTQIGSALQAAYGGHILLLAEEAHADVVPEAGALGRRVRRDTVLVESHVVVVVYLDHVADGHNRFVVGRVERQRVAQRFK